MTRALLLLALLAPFTAAAEIAPKGATVTVSRQEPSAQRALPVGPWARDQLPAITLEGPVSETAWRIPLNTSTPLELLAPLRAELETQGYKTLYECAAERCGGFDFRYGAPLLPEPEMHVDLAEFQYYLGIKGGDYAMVLTSRSLESGFVQVTQMLGAARRSAAADLPEESEAPAPETLAAKLARDGHAPLDDLALTSGSAALEPRDYASLKDLAAYLKTTPDAQIVLVGHTDTSGALAANIALSKARAEAVRAALIALGAQGARIGAEGAGWLSPRASNATPEGQAKNRRVEAILTPTRVK